MKVLLRHIWRLSLAFTIPVLGFGQSTEPNMLLLGAAQSRDHIIVVGERGTILRSDDSGATWQRSPSSTRSTLTSVTFAPDGLVGWACGHSSVILHTSDGGAHWETAYQGDNPEDSFLDIITISSDVIIAVGAYGYYVESRNAGQTWKQRFVQDEDSHFNRITYSNDGILYLAGERGTLLKSTNQGLDWLRLPSPYEGSFHGILPLPNGHILAHGLRGHVFLSQNQGQTWQRISIETEPLLSTSILYGKDIVILGGQARSIFISRDGGAHFQPWEIKFTSAIATLFRARDGRLWALGEAGVSLLPNP